MAFRLSFVALMATSATAFRPFNGPLTGRAVDIRAATATTAAASSTSTFSDSRTTDDAYTSSCESVLESYYSSEPTVSVPDFSIAVDADLCSLSVPASASSAYSAAESEVASWFEGISSAFYSFLDTDCPYLSDYKVAAVSGTVVPYSCLSATTTGTDSGTASATVTGTGATATATTTGSSSSSTTTGTASGTASGTSTSASASGNGSPRETAGIAAVAALAAGVLGLAVAL